MNVLLVRNRLFAAILARKGVVTMLGLERDLVWRTALKPPLNLITIRRFSLTHHLLSCGFRPNYHLGFVYGQLLMEAWVWFVWGLGEG